MITIENALRKLITDFWTVSYGQPDVIGWLNKESINPKSEVCREVVLDFVADYRAFKIRTDILTNWITNIFKRERWRFISSSNEWVRIN